jgi:tetratricopeptide (TPR) repeat protein
LLARFSIYNEIQMEAVGLPAVRRALILHPDDPIGLDLIGYAYYLQSDPASARRFILQSLQANPNYAPARLHLGLVYIEEGRTDQAVLQFARAAELAPGSQTAEQAGQLIRRFAP